MNRQILTIARSTLLEARRTRLVGLAVIAVAVIFAMSAFVAEIAVIESDRLRAAFYAGGARLAAVFVATIYVLVSVTREFNDKGIDVLLALDLPRSSYVLGKLAGYLGIAVALAVVAALPAAWLSGPAAAAQWGLSLALELSVVIALALFCVITFSHLLPAASFVLAFYLLSRSLSAIRLMSAQPVGPSDTLSHQAMTWLVEGIALILPSLDGWTRTAWLLEERAHWGDIGLLSGHALLYVTLLAAAAMFDLYRKNF